MLARTLSSLPLVAVLVACGGNADPAPTITVTGAAGPLAGVDVVFHDGDGAPVASAKTDGTGRASGDIDDGGMITVLLAASSHRELYTFTGVERGDELRLADPRASVSVVGTAHVTVPPFAGASMYVIDALCSTIYTANVSQPIAVEIRGNCLAPDGTLQVLVSAFDADGGVLAVAFLRDLAWTEPMNLLMPPWLAPSLLTVEARQAPARTLAATVAVDHVVHGARFTAGVPGTLLDPGQSASLAARYAGGFGDFVDAHTTVFAGTDIEHLTASTMQRRRWSTPPATHAVDLTADLLPLLWPPTYDGSVPGRPMVRWSDADLSPADAGMAEVSWIDWDESNQDHWYILFPADAGNHVQVPALPDELAVWAPGAAAQLAPGWLQFVDAGWLSSYADYRGEIGFKVGHGDLAPALPAADAVARLTLAEL